jgi:histidine ammonia-lyase
MTAARHAYEIIINTRYVLAIELYTAARAIDLRLRAYPNLHPGKGSQTAHRIIRSHVPYQSGDALWGPEIDRIQALIKTGQFLEEFQADFH